MRQGKIYASIYVRLVDRKERTRSVDEMSAVLRERLKQVPGITVTHVGLLDPVGGQKQIEFSLQGPDLKELERLTALVTGQDPRHSRPGGPGLQRQARQADASTSTCSRDAASDLGLSVAQIGGALRTLVAGQTVGNWRARTTRPTTSTCAWRPMRATRRRTWSACPSPWAPTPTAARASCG